MPLITAKELKRLDNQAFYTELNNSISLIQAQFNRAKKENITYSLSKEGKFDIWLEHSQLTDNVNQSLEDLMQAIRDKKRKSKLLKYYDQMLVHFQNYLDNWQKVDEALKTVKLANILDGGTTSRGASARTSVATTSSAGGQMDRSSSNPHHSQYSTSSGYNSANRGSTSSRGYSLSTISSYSSSSFGSRKSGSV